eukprot:10352.XXX_236321_236467_1 [CDS] Oithona nana genome sequencing.
MSNNFLADDFNRHLLSNLPRVKKKKQSSKSTFFALTFKSVVNPIDRQV